MTTLKDYTKLNSIGNAKVQLDIDFDSKKINYEQLMEFDNLITEHFINLLK